MRGQHFKNPLIALAILIAFGIGRLHVEESMMREMRANHFWPDTIDMRLRDEAGQLAISAALGGFRSLAASVISFKAFNHWYDDRFDQASAQHWIVVNLQPRNFFNWYQGQQTNAYDKAHHILNDENRPTDWQVKYKQAFEDGLRFMEEARKYLPEDFRVYSHMGVMYQERFRPWPQDFCKAAEYYKLAAECPDTKPYYKRFYAYAVSQCPGREEEGYRLLKELFDRGQRFPSLLTHLGRLEEFLGIEPSQRIPERTQEAPNTVLRPGE
jgi:hypothetical protein